VPETNYFYHAKTGKTYTRRITCMSCRKEIPMWPYGPGADVEAVGGRYRCPLCGGMAHGLPDVPPVED
jgi:hypothetical protein